MARRPDTRRLHRETLRRAAALEQAGIETRQPMPETPIELVGAITGLRRLAHKWRNLAILPAVAVRAATKKASALETRLRAHPARDRLRYLVVAPVERVPVGGDLTGRIDEINDMLSSWRKHIVGPAGARVVWTGLELAFDPAGEGSVLVHANLILMPPEMGMGALSKATNRYFGQQGWHDASTIRDISRVCSYVTKVADLCEAPDEAIRWIHQYTHDRQMHRTHPAPGHSVRKEDPAIPPAPSRPEGLGTASLSRQAAPRPAPTSQGAYEGCRNPSRQRKGTSAQQPVEDSSPQAVVEPVADAIENLVIRELGPRHFTKWAEPCLLVQGYTEVPTTVAGREGLALIRRVGGAPARIGMQPERLPPSTFVLRKGIKIIPK
ncbi:hypothetical protein CLV79_10924 [Limimaricola soesokkakensis]|uniref:Uncharacterized protein n=2 Tax=Limimaricola soesokkakensis TaxID=1343159 RepID=A0A1X6ZRV9_9RHOB|nr:hypothetical protein CLV79_10924 [Limimaricola soesokkakensis]SLN59784.1 hypothetical protein LOS8367_02874 [Limimaricola soesokkakensis]